MKRSASVSESRSWEAMLDRIKSAKARIAVIGLGYVGLPLGIAFARKGFDVIGFDVDNKKVALLQDGSSYVIDVQSETVAEVVRSRTFKPTCNPEHLRGTDAIVICVPTPFTVDRAPDLSYIESAAKTIAGVLEPLCLVVLESTSYPGTTEELLVPILESSGRKLHEDFEVAFSPERVDPGNKLYHIENTPKVVGGLGQRAGDLATALYGTIVDRVVRLDSPRDAEMAKLIENTFRQVNIALVNELALIAKRMGVNIWKAIEAAASKPFGFMPFYPGPGVGGHCIPIDPHYLAWKAKELGCEISFIELAERINQNMPLHVVRLVEEALSKEGKPLAGSKVLVLGVSYKRDIDDLRESPALAILDHLEKAGVVVSYHDPYVPRYRQGEKELRSVELTEETVSSADCVLLVTDHSKIDKELVVKHSKAIVDTRNAFAGYDQSKIIRL
ncbi:MAG: nucleotide sugar dehydrogenase [Armatimonadota bacterium]